MLKNLNYVARAGNYRIDDSNKYYNFTVISHLLCQLSTDEIHPKWIYVPIPTY